MLENNRLNELILRFPEDVQLIFKDMIPSYQLGYVDYVYQTDSYATQNRRIKNLAKNFRRMDYFYIMPLPQDLALEIANQWRYQPPLDAYTISANPETYAEMISPEARGDRFFAVIRNAALMGYFCIDQDGETVDIRLGMKPSLTGQGNGRAFYQAIEDYLVEHVQPASIKLTVASSHQVAQKLFHALGFTEIEKQSEYIKMEKKLLKNKQVTVNGQVETSPKQQIDEKSDQIAVAGQVLSHETFVYYVLNKPKGVISATEDDRHRTVLDLLDNTARQKEVFPVGRLDIDTHGLLLLTNNGQLAHVMLSPKKHVDKLYRAQVDGIMTQEDVERFAAGIELKDLTCQPAQLTILSTDEAKQTSLVDITIREGKFHQVKRMVQACGKTVTDLQRLTMGPLRLDPKLALGEYRRLTAAELKQLEVFGVEL